MSDVKPKLEAMLFDYGTTNRTDFRCGEIKEPVCTVYKEKPRCMMIRPPPLKDVHTLSDWKAAAIPFDLLHKPRPIVGTDPRNVQQPFSKPVDHLRAEIQKTRPRLVMTPAVSMDDIEDPRAREILCEDMYTSDTAKGLKEAVSPYFSVRAPFPGLPAPSKPVVLPKLKPPYVSPEWRMESVSWDNKQLRAFCDPSKEFWLARPIPKCSACQESAVIKSNRQISRTMKSGGRQMN